jgi:MFS family permease
MMMGFIAGSVISGQLLSRWGRYRILALAGLVVGCSGLFLLGRMSASTSNAVVVRNMVVLGVGIGSTMPLFSIAVQNAFPHRVLGAVTASRSFFLSLGGAVGVPIMGAMLNSGFQHNFSTHLSPRLAALMRHAHAGALDPNALISEEAQAAIRARFAHLAPSAPTLYEQFIHAVRTALALTIQPLFQLALGFMLAALAITVFLREIPLRSVQVEPEYVTADETASLAGAPEPLELSQERAGERGA